MNRNDPREQRAYSRRLQKLRARSRRESNAHSRRLRDISDAYAESLYEHALDGDLRPAPRRRNREIDDGGLDS